MIKLEDLAYVEAKYKLVLPTSPMRPIDWIVLHAMEAPEKGTTAEAVAQYFKNGPRDAKGNPRPASVHINVDDNSAVRCVLDKDIAYGAGGANKRGLHIEHAGYAKQTREEWLDPFGYRMLDVSTDITSQWSVKYSIPPRFLVADELKKGHRGFTDHDECAKAFGGTHWDVGPNFPFDYYFDELAKKLKPQVEEPDVMSMIAVHPNGAGSVEMTPDGAIYAYGVDYLGAPNNNSLPPNTWLPERWVHVEYTPDGSYVCIGRHDGKLLAYKFPADGSLKP